MVRDNTSAGNVPDHMLNVYVHYFVLSTYRYEGCFISSWTLVVTLETFGVQIYIKKIQYVKFNLCRVPYQTIKMY